ncbi:MAG: PAS domain S-box protein [Nitrospirae bacterium]|nr:PAS domain S-box protein [Nitrospirota bacterium]
MNKAKKSLIKKIIFVAIVVLFIANLNSIVDLFLHPEISYFDNEHLIVGGITAFAIATLLGELMFYIQRLENIYYEQRRSDDALKESESFLRSIFDSIQDGISILDKEMNIISVNAVMEEWYAHNLPLTGKKCYEAYHGRKEPCKVCPSIRTLRRGKPDYEVVPFT